ncbi:3-dehydroquinate dehydratase [Actinobacteria bacterium IMCC26207]|nr:3-dehydroquinate dehydratase [Actinobacteria bacterium IMCC26207]
MSDEDLSEVTSRQSAQRSLLVLSGANLQLLGSRQPEIYGSATLEDHMSAARDEARGLGFSLESLQSNHEGDLVDAIGKARSVHDAIIINPGAFTHYSWAIHDALAACEFPIIEVHLSNPHRREAWRHLSVVSSVATAVIMGLGASGYPMAVRAAAALLDTQQPGLAEASTQE